MMTEQVFARAAALAGEVDAAQREMLRLLCQAEAAGLKARLKEGVTVQDCAGEFAGAAGLCALAALKESGWDGAVGEFRAGDLTVQAAAGAEDAARCLRRQAEMLMAPYLADRFVFAGV